MGGIARDEPRSSTVERLVALLEEGASRGCDLVVFPELALTTFFARWFTDDEAQIESWFDKPWVVVAALAVTGALLYATRFARAPREPGHVKWLDALLFYFRKQE